jgi:branched-chain amino acid transport system substrate-binding protein
MSAPRSWGWQGGGEIAVGALVSLTGDWSSLGIASQAALEIAAEEIRADFSRRGWQTRVRIVARDTKLDPALALPALQELAAQGVRVVIGPQSSAEVAALKPFADANGVLLISQGSTASSLSLPGDNIFRLAPDDTREAAALDALMAADGIRTVVPLWREDAGNQGLRDSVKRSVEARGGSVTAGARYAAANPDLPAALATVRAEVAQAITQQGAASTAVYLAAFDEAATILALAKDDAVLGAVRWYGSDGVVGSTVLLQNADAVAFAAKVGYPSPLFGLETGKGAKWEPVAEKIRSRVGSVPDAFALSAYDALWLVALAAQEAGGTADMARFKEALVRTAAAYTGITGATALNEAGDRRDAGFEFWVICGGAGGAAWKRAAFVGASPDGALTVTRLPGCSAP